MQRLGMIRPYLDEGVPLRRLARAHDVSTRTLQRWIVGYRTAGLTGLVRRVRKDAGTTRRIDPDMRQLIEGLALRTPPPTAAFVHRQVAEFAAARGQRGPSYRAVAAIVHSLGPALKTLAHHGTKPYRDQFDLLHRREASRPNEIWQADHTPLDLWVLEEAGRPARPWLTVILDDYSRAVAGYYVSAQAPNTLKTALALRQAIWRKPDPRWHVCGIPQRFYTDHGSDFTSTHLEQVSAELKMELVFSHVGMPRGRGRIERFFRTLSQLFLCGLPGYTPPDMSPATPALQLADFEQRLGEFLLGVYHARIHSETGVAPQERWEAGGFLPRMPDSLEHLDLLLLTVAKQRRVHQDGIRFGGHRYIDTTLAAYVGEAVTIRYDPRDVAEVRVFYGERFLCRAICQELAGQTVSLQEISRACDRQRRQLARRIREARSFAAAALGHEPSRSSRLSSEPSPSEPASAQPARLKRYANE